MIKRKKILMVTGSLKVGGLENVAMNIMRHIDREKFDIHFVVYGDEFGAYEKEVETLGGKVYHIPFPRQGSKQFCKALRKIMLETGPYDIVHSHNLFPSGLVMMVAKHARVPVRIAHAHTNRDDRGLPLKRKLYQDTMRFLMHKYATAFFACSNRAGKYLFGDDFLKNGYVMQNGVSTGKFQASDTTVLSLKKEFGLENEKIIGHTGRFVEVKNHSFLVDIFKAVCEADENVKLMLIGDGPLRPEIEEKVKALGLDNKVIFTGMRDDVPALLSLFNVYALPSKYEGVSVSLMEAQAAGVPFVVSKSAYSDESRVTGYGTAMDLDAPVNEWRDAILSQMQRGKNKNAAQEFIKMGYDTEQIVRFVEENYYI